MAMKLGVVLPFVEPDGSPLAVGGLAAGAHRIEAAGFDSAWVFDALGRGFLLPDPLAALAIAAAVTTRIELGTGVLQLPLRHPVDLAQRVATCHLACGDRLVLGVGAGSTEADFTAVGADYEQRFTTFAASLASLRSLLAGDEVDGVRLGVWPALLGGPRLLVGSWAGRWIDRAGRELDGWVGSAARTSWTLLADGVTRLRAAEAEAQEQAGASGDTAHAADAGNAGGHPAPPAGAPPRRAVATNIVVDLAAPASPAGGDDPMDLRCPPDEAARRLARLADLGFDEAVCVVARQTPAALAELRALWPRP